MLDEVIETVVPGGAWLAVGLTLGAALGDRIRPVAKEAIKVGLSVADRVQGVAAEAYERTEDLIAEARHEREQASQGKSTRQSSAKKTRSES